MKHLLVVAFLFQALAHQAQGCVQRIEMGPSTATLILSDQTKYSLGLNNNGMLANGTTTPVPYFTKNELLTPFKQIKHGNGHSIAIHNDGTLWGWGSNLYGQVGNGTIVDTHEPVQISTDTDWTSISCAAFHNIAQKSNGNFYAWGLNANKEFDNTNTNNYPTPFHYQHDGSWEQVFPRLTKTFVIKNNGTLWAIGTGISNSTTYVTSNYAQITSANNWKTICQSQESYNLALKNDNTLWAWGRNNAQTINPSANTFINTPTQFGNDTWLDVAASPFHIVGIKTDGTLWLWGYFGWSTFAGNYIPVSYTPVQLGTDTNWKSVSTAPSIVLALKQDNSLYIIGSANQITNDTNTTIYPTLTEITCEMLSRNQPIQLPTTLYPNPAQDILNWSSPHAINHISVYNTLGQELLSQQVSSNSINVQSLPSGVYTIHMTTLNKTLITTLFVKH